MKDRTGFKEALDIVLTEAESSALGDNNEKVLNACRIVYQFFKYLPEDFNSDAPPNMIHKPFTDFCDDAEKMKDFHKLSKSEFLSSYSYLTEEEYNLTRMNVLEKKIDKYHH